VVTQDQCPNHKVPEVMSATSWRKSMTNSKLRKWNWMNTHGLLI